MKHQTIAVIDFGSQYSQLICRRVRETHVYAELVSWDRADELLSKMQPAGIILSGGPNSVYEAGAPTLPDGVLTQGVPVLGICYGLQLLAHSLGGQVAPSSEREYGHATVTVTGLHAGPDNPLFAETETLEGVGSKLKKPLEKLGLTSVDQLPPLADHVPPSSVVEVLEETFRTPEA